MTAPTRRSAAATLDVPWWLYLATSAAWFIIAWLVLRMQTSTVTTVAVLAGAVILVAGLAEMFNAATAHGWRWLHVVLATVFIVTAIVIFFNPGGTFDWLAAFIGWYFLFKGMLDIVLSLVTKDVNDAWWMGLIIGLIEVALGFWAAGHFLKSAFLLIVFVAAIALTRAVTDIVIAIELRKLTHGGGGADVTSGPRPGGLAPA